MTQLCSSTAEAILKVKGEKIMQRFRTVFLPEGRALRPGSFLRMPGLAGVLEAGLLNFYNGNLSQEMEDEVNIKYLCCRQNYSVKIVFSLGSSFINFSVFI